jgi:UDP-N-acetylglucosamine 1-carboxyvinyltransferase
MEEKNWKFLIRKSSRVGGEISVKGAKNHALKVLAASVLTEKKIIIKNIPSIEDIKRKEELLAQLGVKIERNGDNLTVEAKKIETLRLDPEKSKTIRTYILLAGALLGRFGRAEFYHPGGCVLGKRPVDLFLEGFQKLGAEVKVGKKDTIEISSKGRLPGGEFFFPRISVTATEAMIIAAVLAKGKTVLKNCALEPEIVALADFLNRCGAKIEGAGSPTVVIRGVSKLNGGQCAIIPDRIEAGTFLILGALHKAKLNVTHCDPGTLEALIVTLKKAGVELEIKKKQYHLPTVQKIDGHQYYHSRISRLCHRYPAAVHRFGHPGGRPQSDPRSHLRRSAFFH